MRRPKHWQTDNCMPGAADWSSTATYFQSSMWGTLLEPSIPWHSIWHRSLASRRLVVCTPTGRTVQLRFVYFYKVVAIDDHKSHCAMSLTIKRPKTRWRKQKEERTTLSQRFVLRQDTAVCIQLLLIIPPPLTWPMLLYGCPIPSLLT